MRIGLCLIQKLVVEGRFIMCVREWFCTSEAQIQNVHELSAHMILTVFLFKQEAQLLLGDRATRKHAKDSWNGRGNDNLGW